MNKSGTRTIEPAEHILPHATQLQEIPTRTAEIGQGTVIQRALPSRYKRMIGAWCFLDHAGPATFKPGQGMKVGPHPHIGLQTFTWMIEGTVMHRDSVGSEQLIEPGQVNLMTAGYGITHTEVSPESETRMHAAQLWIALPDEQRNMLPKFEHYSQLPVVEKDQLQCTVLVGEFLGQSSPVQVYSPLLGVDLKAREDSRQVFTLNPQFEYGFLVLEGNAQVNGHELHKQNMLVLPPGLEEIELELNKDARLLLIGGAPFETPIVLWWNLVARTSEEIRQAREQWEKHDHRFGNVEGHAGPRLEAPPVPGQMRPAK